MYIDYPSSDHKREKECTTAPPYTINDTPIAMAQEIHQELEIIARLHMTSSSATGIVALISHTSYIQVLPSLPWYGT